MAATAQQKKRVVAGEELPTGMSITPLAARGSTLQPLNPGLPDLPAFTVDHPISTAVSPDGNTLLILTSGYNRNNDAKGKKIAAQTSEYIFVFDIRQAKPVQKQALRIPNAYMGLAWAPDGRHFYAGGGKDDNVHVFTQESGDWSESEKSIALGHKTGLGVADRSETKVTPIEPMVAGLAVSPDGKLCLSPTIKMILFHSSSWKQISVILNSTYDRAKSIPRKRAWPVASIHMELLLPAMTKLMSPACAIGRLLRWQ